MYGRQLVSYIYIAKFYISQIGVFFKIEILRRKVNCQILFCYSVTGKKPDKLRIPRKNIRIARYKHAIVRKKFQNCGIKS